MWGSVVLDQYCPLDLLTPSLNGPVYEDGGVVELIDDP
jgi:hypothetical protein